MMGMHVYIFWPMYVYVCSSLVRISLFRSPLKSCKSEYNQTWFKGAIAIPSYVNEVRGHIPRSRIIRGQGRLKRVFLLFYASQEKLKSNYWNQTWVKDAMPIPLYVILRSSQVENVFF